MCEDWAEGSGKHTKELWFYMALYGFYMVFMELVWFKIWFYIWFTMVYYVYYGFTIVCYGFIWFINVLYFFKGMISWDYKWPFSIAMLVITRG